MIRIEVTLPDSFEIHNIPSIPNLSWMDNNTVALQTVYDDLIRRNMCLDGLQISARDLEFCPVVPINHCLWCLSPEHLLAECSEKHNLFALTWNDEQFLDAVGIWYPRWVDGRFVADPLKERR